MLRIVADLVQERKQRSTGATAVSTPATNRSAESIVLAGEFVIPASTSCRSAARNAGLLRARRIDKRLTWTNNGFLSVARASGIMTDQSRPYSIRIYLPDGTPEGVRVIEKSNWKGIGIVVPRSLLAEAKNRDEFLRTGVYVLIGHDEQRDMPTIYIGQGDPVRKRLEYHHAHKEFWTWAVFFVTTDDSLNKAHIGYLESELVQLARDAKRAQLDNQNNPQPSPLSEADTADMDWFLTDMLSIFPLLGLMAFEKVPQQSDERSLLFLNAKGLTAEGYESPQGFVVKAGSRGSTSESATIQAYQSASRTQLKQQGILVGDGDALKMTQDHVFTSSTTAAAVLLGRNASGPQSWKDSSGRTLKQIQEEAAES
jgi:hypothetical protein